MQAVFLSSVHIGKRNINLVNPDSMSCIIIIPISVFSCDREKLPINKQWINLKITQVKSDTKHL